MAAVIATDPRVGIYVAQPADPNTHTGSRSYEGGQALKIIAQQAICAHHGLCFVVDAELFPLDDDGRIAIDEDGIDVPEGKEDLAREGVIQCPVLALRIEE